MKYLLSTLFVVFSFYGSSQVKQSDSSASCIAFWKKGEKKIFSITHTRKSYESGTLKSDLNLSYEAHVDILDSSSSGYKIQWTFRLPALLKPDHPSLAGSLPVYEGMKMIFNTSEMGAFIELLNWEEVKNTYVKMMELSLPKNLDSAGKAAVDQSKALFNSREMVEGSMINEIQLFHFPFGYKFSTTETRENVQLSNPFANEPLPAVQTYQITELKPGQDYFKLIVKQDINKDGAEKVFEGLFKKMNLPQDSSIAEAKKILSTLEMTDYREYNISQVTGWVKKVIYKKTVKNSQINQVDTYIVEMEN